MNEQNVERLGVEYIKPPFKLLGYVIYCDHVWATRWKQVDESISVGIETCKRCLKERLQ